MHTHSGKQAAIKKSRTSRKRRENQNVVINELASLVPLSTPLVSCDSSSGSLVPSSGNKPPTISVLRLTTSYIKLHNFIQTSKFVSLQSYFFYVYRTQLNNGHTFNLLHSVCMVSPLMWRCIVNSL